jgi:hypothetical protein
MVVFKLWHQEVGYTLRADDDEERAFHGHIRCSGEIIDGVLRGDYERVQAARLHESL